MVGLLLGPHYHLHVLLQLEPIQLAPPYSLVTRMVQPFGDSDEGEHVLKHPSPTQSRDAPNEHEQ